MWDYPETKPQAVTDEVHGQKIVDQFRWLEDSDSTAVTNWSKDQNDFTANTLKNHTKVVDLEVELTEYCDIDSLGLSSRKGDYYFFSHRQAGQNQSVIYRKLGLNGDPELLLDPNGKRADDAITVSRWSISPEGRYFTYCLVEGGTEMGTLFIRDLQSGQELDTDTIPNCRYPSTAWLEDETGFFYTKCPEPGTVPQADEQYYMRVYRHTIGHKYIDDPIIFGENRHKEDIFGLHLSDDRQTLIISASRNSLQNEVHLHEVETGKNTSLVAGLKAKFGLSIMRGKAYLWTNYQADFGRMLIADASDLPESIDQWQEALPERGYKFTGLSFTGKYILATYRKDACSIVEVLDYALQKQFDLELPPFSSLSSLSGHHEQEEFFYGYTTFLTPCEAYRFNPDTNSSEFYSRTKTPIDPTEYQVSQQWYSSKDGTKVPMFIISRNDVKADGHNPTLLYGYGGFGSSSSPGFVRGLVPFLRRGGVYAVANIRGGGEYGQSWHEAGIRENKQNSFDDFIAAAEYLVDQKYTNSAKLAIMGGSNGGTLVGAVMVQRPELFKAVVCRVPLLDMVRFPDFLIASRWTAEFGDPKVKDEFEYIIKWSPYHNVKPATEYPACLFMTGEHDTRVEPLHARKMAALLQSTNQTNTVLIRTETAAGHGSGTPLNKWVTAQADMLAFLAWQLEMD